MRKTHMPMVEASRCCSRSEKWCCKPSTWWGTTISTSRSANRDLLLVQFVVVVGLPGYDGGLFKIVSRRRGGGLPLQASGVPGIVAGDLAVAQRPEEVDHGQDIADGENAGAGGRKHVEHLEFGSVLPVAARHAGISENELREERQVESHKDDESSEAAPAFGIHAAGNFGPPEMQAAEVRHDHASHHDVVEVRDDEVGVGHVHVDAKRGEEESSQTAHRKQADEAERVEHGSVVRDGTLVHGGGPVEHLDG